MNYNEVLEKCEIIIKAGSTPTHDRWHIIPKAGEYITPEERALVACKGIMPSEYSMDGYIVVVPRGE